MLTLKFENSVDLNYAEAIVVDSGSAIKNTISFDFVPAILVVISSDKSLDDMIQYLELDPSVEYAHRNYNVTLGRL